MDDLVQLVWGRAFPSLVHAFHYASTVARVTRRRRFVCMREGQWWVSER